MHRAHLDTKHSQYALIFNNYAIVFYDFISFAKSEIGQRARVLLYRSAALEGQET
jgi:hypothetical protein